MDIENLEHVQKDQLTRKEISKIILHRYKSTSYSFIILFVVTLALNIILSIYADQENFYRFGPNAVHWGLALSDSMTGNISKPVASILIFISALYLLSLVQFQFIFFKILIGHCINQNEITQEVAEKIWLNNRVANAIANFAVLFMMILTLFDTWKFQIIHNIFAVLFFIFIITYQIFRRKIEIIVIGQKLVGEIEKKNAWILYLSIISLICFTGGYGYFSNFVKREERFKPNYLPALILINACEYLLCIFSVLNFAMNSFVKEKIFNQYDFKELLHLKMFCLVSIFNNLLCTRKHIPVEILQTQTV